MAKITLADLTGSFASVTSLNSNFQAIEDALNDLVLFRDNPDGEINYMLDDLDMNSNRIINLPAATTNNEPVTYAQWIAAADTAITANTTLSEEQTASTDGQSLFTLSLITYNVGSKNLSVYRNGTKLPSSSYVETSDSSITLSAANAVAVKAGDEFEFIVNQRNVDSDTVLASNVTFTPAGSGAVTTDAQTKLRERVSVMDFGATGDGATDDTAAIQAAIDHVNSSYLAGTFGGEAGEVLFDAKVYKYSGLTIKKGVSLIGKGQNNTVLLLDTNGATGIVTPAKVSQLAADAVSQSVLRGIGFGIHSSLTPSSTTILLDTSGMTRCLFDDLAFTVPANVIGIDNTGNTLAGSGGPAHWYNDWLHCFVDVSGGTGIRWGDNDSGVGEQVTAQTFRGGRIGGTSGTGIHIRGGTGNSFHGTTFEGLNGVGDDTIIMGDSSGARVTTSNNFHGCYLEQVKITYNSNTNRNRRWGCYETTVAETDNGTRNGRVDNEQLYLGWSRNYVSGRVTTPTTVNKNYNIDTVSKVGTGIYDVNFDVTMSDTNYVAIAQAESSDAIPRISTKTTTSVRVVFENRAGTAVDPTSFVITVQDNQ